MSPTATFDPILSAAQKQQYADEGYLLLPGLLDDDSLQAIRDVFEQAVDKQAREWFDAGNITDACEGLPFEKRYGALREQLPAGFSNSWRRIIVSRALYNVWRHPVLVNLMRSLIGDELYASTTWNGRPRAQNQLKQTIDWHQDAHYMPDYQEGDGHAVSVWMPLVAVDETSGCLQVAPKSNLGGLRPPTRLERNGLTGLADSELESYQPLSCIMAPGDVLLFSELTFHRSLDNISDYVRWSLDVRFFDADNAVLRQRDGRGNSRGYVCFSESDPSRVETYDTWAAKYDYEGEF